MSFLCMRLAIVRKLAEENRLPFLAAKVPTASLACLALVIWCICFTLIWCLWNSARAIEPFALFRITKVLKLFCLEMLRIGFSFCLRQVRCARLDFVGRRAKPWNGLKTLPYECGRRRSFESQDFYRKDPGCCSGWKKRGCYTNCYGRGGDPYGVECAGMKWNVGHCINFRVEWNQPPLICSPTQTVACNESQQRAGASHD